MTWQPCNLSTISLTFLLIQQYHQNDNDDNDDNNNDNNNDNGGDDGGGGDGDGDGGDTLTMIVLHKWRHFCEWRHAGGCYSAVSILIRTSHPLYSSIALNDDE